MRHISPLNLDINEDLDKNLPKKISILEKIQQRNKNGEFDYLKNEIDNAKNIKDLIDVSCLKSPQIKGLLIEEFICKKLGWKHVLPNKHVGDGYSIDEKRHYEIKTSFANNKIVIKQIRLFQKIDRYLCIHFDEYNIDDSIVFVLSHEEMANEVKDLGKKTSNIRRKKCFDIEIEFNSNEYNRWIKLYKNDFIKQKIFK